MRCPILVKRLPVLCTILALLHGPALAQWPAKPVRLVLPNAAGSTPDFVTRNFVELIGKATGQAWVVENRPGGNGIIGTMTVVKAAPDGYTFLMAGTENLALAPLMLKEVPYDPFNDLDHAAVVIDTNGFAIAAAPSLPADSVRDLMTMAKAKPGTVTYATSVSLAELLGLWLQKEAGVQLREVRYKSIAQGIQDVIGGRVHVVVNSYTNLEPLVKAGKLKVLAVSTADRMPGLPSIPTVAETYPGVAVGGFLVLVAPAGTPREVIERVNRETNTILANREFGERVFRYGWHNVRGPRSVAETAGFVRTRYAGFRSALEATGYRRQ